MPSSSRRACWRQTLPPDPIDDAVYGSLKLILDEPEVRRSIRAVAEALPQHRPAVVQQLFAEGM